MGSAMGGLRTTGDLVAWMQMARKMKINDAKQYVAKKLGVEVIDLTDEEKMLELREELDIGTIISMSGASKGIQAKCKIAKLLDIEINSVNLFKDNMRDFI